MIELTHSHHTAAALLPTSRLRRATYCAVAMAIHRNINRITDFILGRSGKDNQETNITTDNICVQLTILRI